MDTRSIANLLREPIYFLNAAHGGPESPASSAIYLNHGSVEADRVVHTYRSHPSGYGGRVMMSSAMSSSGSNPAVPRPARPQIRRFGLQGTHGSVAAQPLLDVA